MNIITTEGFLQMKEIWPFGIAAWQSRLVYIGNICRILTNAWIDDKYIETYVKRGIYELFCNKKITEEVRTFAATLYPETYLYDFLNENVGYQLKIKGPKPVIYTITHDVYSLYTALCGTKKKGLDYLKECSKVILCYRILMDIVDGNKPPELDYFLNFKIRKMEADDVSDDMAEFQTRKLLEEQMKIMTVFENAIVEYNDCSSPLELMNWYDKYSIVYAKNFGDEIPNANDMVDVFHYSTGSTVAPNHNNIKYK